MCLGGSPKFTLPAMPEPEPAPPAPPPQWISAAPVLPAAPAQKNRQTRAKTRASSRRSKAAGKTGKRRYTIPLSGGGPPVSGVTATGVNA